MNAPLPFGRITAATERGAAALRSISGRLSYDRVVSGGWFRKLAVEHIRKRDTAALRGVAIADVEKRADAVIARACMKASTAGVIASTVASTGEVVALFTEGLSAPISVPAIVISMLTEAGYTALLQIDLACDLAALFGVPFDVDDLGDLTALFALALELPPPKPRVDETPATEGGLMARLMELEDGEVGRRIGRKLFEDSLVKNIVPFAGIPFSARFNYVATRRLGATVRRYVRYRRALRDTLSGLQLDAVAEPELLVEGAWLLGTMDAPTPNGETAMAIGLIVEALPEAVREEIGRDRAFGDDEEGWFDALGLVPPSMHRVLLDVLCLVAASDKELKPSERRFLQRVGRALNYDIDLERVEAISRNLAEGRPFNHATSEHPPT